MLLLCRLANQLHTQIRESWIRFSSGGVKQETSVSFQVDVQTFTANGTWTKPTSYTPKEVTVIFGAGGGGGGSAGMNPVVLVVMAVKVVQGI